MADQAPGYTAPVPNGRTGWHDFIDIFAALFNRDNLVILCLTFLVSQSIGTFGSAQPGLVKEILIYVAGGFTGYLGGEVKKLKERS